MFQKRRVNLQEKVEEDLDSVEGFSPEILEKLHFLEEANSFFGHSLKASDMFRLISHRINELIPFNNCVLYLLDENKRELKPAQAEGESAENFLKNEFSRDSDLVEKVFKEQTTQIEKNIVPENLPDQPENAKVLKESAAVPLSNDDEIYGVLALYSETENNFNEKSLNLLEEIGLRISPLFLNSLTFERNLENSLTDSVTKLPNERALFLILENQIAESRRAGELLRPLTVLNIDIRKFDEINRNYGYAAGDRILEMAAKVIKGQLRQMDFLARSKGDEFLAVLPTANEEITRVIIERIEKALDSNPFEIQEDRHLNLKLNYGSATFIKNEETAQQLLKRAALNKERSKEPQKNSVLVFPGEFVN